MAEASITAQLPIVLDDVHVNARSTQILCGVSLRIEAGAPTVLIGPNGSGKTTLLRAAMGLARPDAGQVTWGGQFESSMEHRALVFQRSVMLRRSVAGNIEFALAVKGITRAQRPRRIASLLERVGLSALAERPARRLSGGERQRLALARALARDPAVLFLDEPTASLDPAATLAIEELIRSVSASGVKVVMATHDLGEAARLSGDVVLLHRGAIVEHTDAARFFNSPVTSLGQRFVSGQLLSTLR